MSKQFTDLVEDSRKEQLMARKTARKSLPFDSPPKSARYRHEKFTPPRHAPEKIRCTQEDDDFDFERDSLASQSSRTARTRLQEKWRFIGSQDKLTKSTEEIKEWIEVHAKAEMQKSGMYDDVTPVPGGFGGFKRAHVRIDLCSFISYCFLSNLNNR
jgi:hypothetical protein